MRHPWQVLCIAILVGSLTLVGCAPTPTSESSDSTTTTESTTTVNPFAEYTPRLEGMAKVEMLVNGESIIIELNGEEAPITAGNFADLVERGVYDGLAFHRVIRDPEPFVAQGGDPVGKDPDVPIAQLGRGGYTEPETGVRRDLPLEIKLKDSEEPVYGRASLDPTKVVLKHEKGTIAMARSQAPNSASAQFYFTLAELAFLDGNYAVFGKVVEGIDVVDNIQMGDRIESATIIEGLDNLIK
ncbi:peptidyl-prolyl cis-trans isomerase cyclophilin type [[Leptolyngbya] sp. PCC 7376]|uniref:peptidylprolyl isomerase n=1 Tax=[Leptolyngbya] sp. PCC 7376 TaxID=111781 RepID=UPI00029F2787|nr:peptidylprolyl isomerase [[Leptolyngbya] sp. PCC 7376]AFY40381.1 peptidyl-prolyl cis-trans isomerase cyclophilin type [[Leptolyngbya] sp. PCC 7376]